MDILSAELTETIKKDRKLNAEEDARYALKGLIGNARPYVRRYLQNKKFSSIVYMVDGSVPNEPELTDPPVVVYNIRFRCVSIPEPRWMQLRFWETPFTVLDIKQRVEKKHNIPVSLQNLRYKDKELMDWERIVHIGIENKDSLELRYISEGNIDEVKVVYRWFEFVWKLIKDNHTSIWTGMTAEVQFIVTAGLRDKLAENLCKKLLRPWSADRSYANRNFFNDMDGIKMVMNVYEQLSPEQWRGIPVILKMMETSCIQVLAAVTGSDIICNSVARVDGTGYVLRSLMRVKLQRGKAVVDTSGSPGRQEHNDFLVKEMLQACLEFLVSFRERSGLHLDVCSKPDILEQVICIAHSPSFSTQEAQAAMCVMACAAQSKELHKWMCRTNVLEGICDVIRVRKKMEGTRPKDLKLLCYYVQVALSFVSLTSSHHISQRLLLKVALIMEDFLVRPNVKDIALTEKATPWLIGWDPYPPFLRLLYPPPDTPEQKKLISRYAKSDCMLIRKLHLLSMETFLIVLQVMIQHDPDGALFSLRNRKLLEYFLCLPQNVPDTLRERAKDAVELLRTAKKATTIPVPKLNIMVRAYFAKNHFGLKKVIDMSADDIRMEVSPPPLPPNVVVQGKGDPPAYMHKDATPIYVLAL